MSARVTLSCRMVWIYRGRAIVSFWTLQPAPSQPAPSLTNLSEQSPGPGSAAPGATGQPGQSATGDGAKPGKPDPSPWPEPDVGLYEIVRHGSHAFDIDLKTPGEAI